MSKILLLAEKPSVSKAIEAVYEGNRNILKYDLVCDSFHGHLMGLKEPYEINPEWKVWKESDLPIIPDRIPYKTIDGRTAKRLADRIRYENFEYVINACDAAIEGELIFWSFYLTMKLKVPVKRYWASSNSEEGIKKALLSLRPQNKKEPLVQAAFLRARMDWLFGMNGSRALTLALGQTMALGRVMTTVENLVVKRENEILNFKEENFYEVVVVLEKDGEKFSAKIVADENGFRFKTKNEADSFVGKIGENAKVLDVVSSEKKTKAPLLLSLAGLQKLANREYGFTPDKTLEIAQSLYEKGWITYPRTDSSYLTSDMVNEIYSHVENLKKLPGYGKFAKAITKDAVLKVLSSKAYVDDSKVEDHHAIIPDAECIWKEMSEGEKKIYCIVVRQFLSIFMPEKVEKMTDITLISNKVTMKTKGKIIEDKGFGVLYKNKTFDDTVLPDIKVGDLVAVKEVNLNEGKTSPPERYTPATMIAAMQNAGRFVDDQTQKKVLAGSGGIGTAATRAEILKKLQEKEYFMLENNHYRPSELCMKVMAQIGNLDFCTPSFTAELQDRLNSFSKGGQPELKKEIDSMVAETVDVIFSTVKKLSTQKKEILGPCPLCGSPVLSGKKYYCSSNCGFYLFKTVSESDISENDLRILLEGGSLPFRNLKTKDGTKFRARLILDNEGKIRYVFPNEEPVGKCPYCEKFIKEGREVYFCDCGFAVAKKIMQADISRSDIKNIIVRLVP